MLDIFILSALRTSWISLVVVVEPVPCCPFFVDELDYCKELGDIELRCRPSP
jgi:hypothetical protein